MPRRLTFALTDSQRICLGEALKHHPLPYVRERASALLKVAEGRSVPQVAQHGLLQARQPDTLYRWIVAYQEKGIVGLKVGTGRGRKPAFSPGLLDRSGGERHPASCDPSRADFLWEGDDPMAIERSVECL